MGLRVLVIIALLLLCPQMDASSSLCIEPRNSFSQDGFADLQWSPDDTLLYVSTMGRVSIFGPDESPSPIVIHEVCAGRFPVIGVTNSYYAIGSDFLPALMIYATETHRMTYQLTTEYENIRSVGFSDAGAQVVMSTSNYDEGGFFDIDRNIEVRDYQSGDTMAELLTDGASDAPYLPYDANVAFASAEIVAVMGMDLENAFVLYQPLSYLWNWRTGEVRQIDLEVDSWGVMMDASTLVVPNATEGRTLSLQLITLQPEFRIQSPLVFDIPVEDPAHLRLSANAGRSLLAIADDRGQLWIVDLVAQEIIAHQELQRHATRIALDHAGQRLALGYRDGTLEVWDLTTGTVIALDSIFAD